MGEGGKGEVLRSYAARRPLPRDDAAGKGRAGWKET